MDDRWKKFTTKKDKLKLSDDVEITVSGLTFSELGQMAQFKENKDYSGLMKYIVFRTLEKAPEFEPKAAIPEFIENLDANIGGKILEAVFKISGIDTPEKN
jgi:hypothetical protein